MSTPENYSRAPASRAGLIGLFIAWIVTVIVVWDQTNDPMTALVLVGVIPFAMAAVIYLLSKTPLEMTSFLLPGLLIFFKQNDALIPFLFGGLPVNDMLGVLLLIYLLVRVRNEDLIDTYRAANILLLSIAGLLAAFVISWIYAVELEESRRETLTFVKDLVFALLIALSIRNIRDLRAFVGWLLLSTTFVALAMIWESALGRPFFPDTIRTETWRGEFRSAGASLEDVPSVATMIAMGVFISLILALRSPTMRLIMLAAAAIGVLAILESITRSAVLVLAAATLFLLWMIRRERIFPYAGLAAGAAAVVVFMSLPASTVEKFTALSDDSADRTVTRRVDYIRIGADLFQESPVLGIGAGNYPWRYGSDDYKFERSVAGERRVLHNVYIQYPVEIGIVGAVSFYTQLIAIGLIFWRGTKAANAALRRYSEAMLLGYFILCVQLLFLASKSFLGVWILTAAAIAIAKLYADERRNEHIN